jgi:hypothetical protein
MPDKSLRGTSDNRRLIVALMFDFDAESGDSMEEIFHCGEHKARQTDANEYSVTYH